jgi:hypothetical protein
MIARILQRPVAWICAGAFIFTLIGLTVRSCTQARQASSEARYSNENAKAVSDSGKDAVGAVAASGDRREAIQRQVEGSSHEINAAPIGHRNDAALRASCRMRSYRHTERCLKLLGPDPD